MVSTGSDDSVRHSPESLELLTANSSQAKRIADTDEAIHRGGREADSNMEIELLPGRWSVGCTKAQKMFRAPLRRKIACILDERIPWLSQVAVDEERGFSGLLRAPSSVGQYTDSIPAAVQFRDNALDQGSWTNGS